MECEAIKVNLSGHSKEFHYITVYDEKQFAEYSMKLHYFKRMEILSAITYFNV